MTFLITFTTPNKQILDYLINIASEYLGESQDIEQLSDGRFTVKILFIRDSYAKQYIKIIKARGLAKSPVINPGSKSSLE